jgi:Flp pilus assembly secretin CpaC
MTMQARFALTAISNFEIETTNDVRLIGRAMRERWPIADNLRAGIVQQLVKIIATSDSDRARVAAARVLKDMDALNQSDEHFEANQLEQLRFLEVADEIGIGGLIETTAEGSTDTGDETPTDPTG